MTDPELVETVRWRIAETLGIHWTSMRSLVVITPEKLDALAEAATKAALENDDGQDRPCDSP